jgi:hypothetical protein
MEMLPTYTAVFRSRSRRLYHVAGWELPRSVPIAQALGFLAVAALNVLALRLVGVRWDPGRTWLWVVPPAAGVYGLSRPVADARRLHEWLWAQIRHLCEPKTLHGLRRAHEPTRVRLTAAVWVPIEPVRTARRRKCEPPTSG